MTEIMTSEQLKEYVRTMPDDVILSVTIETEADDYGRDERER